MNGSRYRIFFPNIFMKYPSVQLLVKCMFWYYKTPVNSSLKAKIPSPYAGHESFPVTSELMGLLG